VLILCHNVSVEVLPDEFGNWKAPIAIDAWEGYRCENSRGDATGERVILVLQPADERNPEEVGKVPYERALQWVLANSVEVRESALTAIFKFIRETLIGEYGLDDPELLAIEGSEGLRTEMDLSYLRLFPYSKDDLPFFSLEFE